jgi:hypothetical protein
MPGIRLHRFRAMRRSCLSTCKPHRSFVQVDNSAFAYIQRLVTEFVPRLRSFLAEMAFNGNFIGAYFMLSPASIRAPPLRSPLPPSSRETGRMGHQILSDLRRAVPTATSCR